MDGPPASDKSLLERLNALKPSSVSLTDPPSSISKPISTIERAKSPSREDALTARLKNLRNQASVSASASTSVDTATTDQTQPSSETAQPPTGLTEFPTGSKLDSKQATASNQVTDDVDPLLYTDDQALEDLLADLRADDSWLDEVAAEEEERQRVTALLTELGKSSGVRGETDSQDVSRTDGEESSDDDSDGEVMTKEVDSVLAKAKDELDWERANRDSSPSPAPRSGDAKEGSQGGTSSSPNEAPFNLPGVPSELQDQPDLPASSTETTSDADADFAASIAFRMAALKLSGPRGLPSAPTVAVDSLGLPQAPTFAPADRPIPGLAQRKGLTDEDQKTWCVVCLEDGTIRCLGCEVGDNVYCARCWKEMHIGPQAGYDERGHSWESFKSRMR
ncbi:hypothetical protein F5B22DRAFT_618513 [Xylaria bambusicola]|uniref:uncharacterized protein n=1 Tax=Xylaria bambusicola TaxID=326684 RepID=UPI0020080528|nr:uncharacterized protein F5B22DRAFT_618513 [Xylaria bambusicola]KAI0509113.1 hypothetical protein F5B22DRAFT_618513 [Xylaria bambusicola]